jgi:hypothetical protein
MNTLCITDGFTSYKNVKNFDIIRTTPLFYGQLTFVVSRGEQFTPFEKLLLPFDLETWIMVIITFIIGYSTIFICYLLSKSVQHIIFGDSNRCPSLIMTQIFFGIGCVNTPSKSFPRVLFMIFTLYCLIIRTAYQGKMFDFLHSKTEKPTPKTMQDLIAQQVPVFCEKGSNGIGEYELL